jgi:hypothetical protein
MDVVRSSAGSPQVMVMLILHTNLGVIKVCFVSFCTFLLVVLSHGLFLYYVVLLDQGYLPVMIYTMFLLSVGLFYLMVCAVFGHYSSSYPIVCSSLFFSRIVCWLCDVLLMSVDVRTTLLLSLSLLMYRCLVICWFSLCWST